MKLKELLRLFSCSMSFTIEIETDGCYTPNEYINREQYEEYPEEIEEYEDYYIEGIYEDDGRMMILIAEYEDA